MKTLTMKAAFVEAVMGAIGIVSLFLAMWSAYLLACVIGGSSP